MKRLYFQILSMIRKKEALKYLPEHVNYDSKINVTGDLKDCLDRLTYEDQLDDVIKSQEKKYAEEKNLDPSIIFLTIKEIIRQQEWLILDII